MNENEALRFRLFSSTHSHKRLSSAGEFQIPCVCCSLWYVQCSQLGCARAKEFCHSDKEIVWSFAACLRRIRVFRFPSKRLFSSIYLCIYQSFKSRVLINYILLIRRCRFNFSNFYSCILSLLFRVVFFSWFSDFFWLRILFWSNWLVIEGFWVNILGLEEETGKLLVKIAYR